MITTDFWLVPGLITLAYWLYRSRRGRRAYGLAARAIGGTVGYASGNGAHVGGIVDGFRLTATVRRIRVDVGGAFPLIRLRLTQQALVVAEGPFGLFSLEWTPEPTLAEDAIEAFGGPGQDVLVGDTAFDSAVIVDGPEADALAVLDAASRGGVMRLMRLGLSQITLKPMEMVVAGSPVRNGRGLVQRIEEVASLANAVARRGNVPERLATNARTDPIADVRLRNLDVLLNQYHGWSGTKQACRDGLADRNPWIRLRAAVGLGRQGSDMLAELALNSVRYEAVAASAIESLAVIAEREQVTSICLQVLSSGKGDARRKAIDALGRLRHAPALEGLVRTLSEAEEPVAAAAARALGRIGGEQAESALQRAISDATGDVQVEAVRGLGAIGSVEAIPKLRDLTEGARVRRAVRRLAEEAIRRIQCRLTDAEAGQLALAGVGPQQGALSMVEPEPAEGRLSLPAEGAEREAGRGSGS